MGLPSFLVPSNVGLFPKPSTQVQLYKKYLIRPTLNTV